MKIDPRTPVIVGVGQLGHGLAGCREPLELMEAAIARASADTGRAALLNRVDLVSVARTGTVRYRNAAGAIALRLGLADARTLQADYGGHMAQMLVTQVAGEIAAGRSDVALVAGGETGSLLRGPGPAPASIDSAAAPDAQIGDDIESWISHPHEESFGMTQPVQVYPLLEVALAWENGTSLSAHMGNVARLWARFSEVAATNIHASDRQLRRPDELYPATETNRLVGFPYTRLMCSDQFVDQACALILCSSAAADAAGIALDRRIYPVAAAEARSGFVSHRASLSRAPALARAGAALARIIGKPLAEADVIDLYACFPAAVEIQARALGLDLASPLTATGGMRFAGGPWNSYALHMVANVVERVRQSDGGWAVVSGNGGLASRFSLGAFAGEPSKGGLVKISQPFLPAPDDCCTLDQQPQGEARIEAFSVAHDRTRQPREAFVACRTDAGARAWARVEDGEALKALMSLDCPGATMRFSTDGAELQV